MRNGNDVCASRINTKLSNNDPERVREWTDGESKTGHTSQGKGKTSAQHKERRQKTEDSKEEKKEERE